MAFSSHFLL
ncbi:uncharacterized protein CELE_Y46G5A.47 [Caenorhabditis elegans]|uniref:Uncharacterized protein n=1 Tax=Caenorhabditis elegans TaxID=6239 RepID=A0A2K5ATS1_CAEEL|nr:Uncharacterized protein CELE_Y46G5A.47 [Caenorhabditis elegans]SPC47309.1 Uncharacterized protein CELE_Y46G5A.47 [Caenorhabditis elegans]|eukprot:NP_001348722.1 Uncharacterized protein CELE_Y46G5A.47 [Caenorhabditis elegans]